MGKFCIVSTPRTGSSYLVSALRHHPEIFCHGEIFHDKLDWHVFGKARNFVDISLREKDPILFVDTIMNTDEGTPHIGFKIFNGHNDHALDYILNNRDIKKILLRRSNTLASFSSLRLAEKTDLWNSTEEGNINEKIYFDVDDFIAYSKIQQNLYSYYDNTIRNSGQEYKIVEYKDVISNNFTEILEFIGANGKFNLKGDTKKLYSSCMLDRFKNPYDVSKYLSESNKLEYLVE